MADKQTLQIDANEWRALFLENLQRTANFVSQNPTLTSESLKALHAHLDRSKMIAAAWCAAGRPVVTHAPAPLRVEAMGVPTPAIFEATADAPKRKGGWPKGKPRTRQKPTVVNDDPDGHKLGRG
jgi:hypothetical protein